jgi:hypothetical protein
LQQQSSTQSITIPQKATVGFALSLIAGVLILVQGIVRIIRGELLDFGLDLIRRRLLSGVALEILGAIAIVLAIPIIMGSFLIYSPGKETIGGILVLIFSILSLFTGGGFVAGFILGTVGGILGLLKK